MPSLYGLNNTSRDFSKKDSWGKNQFNSSFPASLCCYMSGKGMESNYIVVDDNLDISIDTIPFGQAFGVDPQSEECHFSFESTYQPFQQFVEGTLPRTDLVVKNSHGDVAALEVKLTALPDHTTCTLTEDLYGSEIVVRPDTIVYLCCSLAKTIGRAAVQKIFSQGVKLYDWSDANQVLQNMEKIQDTINLIVDTAQDSPQPFLLQPVWKTEGKSSQLAENCLDTFIWSDVAFLKFVQNISQKTSTTKINRQQRTLVWIYKMLSDYGEYGTFNHEAIIDGLSYNTKNDKAFASSGVITNKYMSSPSLVKPRVSKGEIKEIILSGGQQMLQPERRFDAIIYNSPDIFDAEKPET